MTTAGWIDLACLALLAAGAVGGWRRGGLRLAGSVAGLIAGTWLGLALIPPLAAPLTGTIWWVVVIGGLLLAASLGGGLGRWLGSLVATVVYRLHLGLLDRLAGAGGGLLLTLVAIGVVLSLAGLGHVTGQAAEWWSAARASTIGSASSQVADRAWDAVRTGVNDSGHGARFQLPTGPADGGGAAGLGGPDSLGNTP